jgi:glucose-6-phosphate isomerase
MLFSYHNPTTNLVNEKKIEAVKKRLSDYSSKIEKATSKDPEYSLHYPAQQTLHDELANVAKKYKAVKEVLLIGIGGSSLGTEAIHKALRGSEENRLTVLDTVSPSDLSRLDGLLKRVKKPSDLAVCVVSKSGGTTETMSNVAVVIKLLEDKFKSKVHQQFIFIGNPGTDFMKDGKRFGGYTVGMPEVIGGRYSVATAVGLVPLQLLGHDVDEYISGYLAASTEEFEEVAKDSASHLYLYARAGYRHYNFFAFETRLATAIYGGVVGAYQDKKLPYRSTIFADESRAFSLGLFMGLRLREIMYLAHLLNLNAFDQPNVESYKIKTKEILGL